MNIPILFSTVTGNAVKIAFAIKDLDKRFIGPYNILYALDDGIGRFRVNNVTDIIVSEAEIIILIYWCDLGSADKETTNFLETVKGKNIIIIGTLGAEAESEQAMKVTQRVRELVEKNNILLIDYLCRGSVDLARSRKRRQLPEEMKGYLTMEAYERHLQSQNHPNINDIQQAINMVKKGLEKYDLLNNR